MEQCKHVHKLTISADGKLLNPASWSCAECATTESIWACLTCGHVACGRYIGQHSAKHYEATQHPIAFEVNEGFAYCYECDDYILNDNKSGDIRLLRDVLSVIKQQKFSAASRGGRLVGDRQLRQRSPADALTAAAEGGDHATDDAGLTPFEMQTVVLKFRRMSSLSRAFTAWRDLTIQSRSGPANVTMSTRRSSSRLGRGKHSRSTSELSSTMTPPASTRVPKKRKANAPRLAVSASATNLRDQQREQQLGGQPKGTKRRCPPASSGSASASKPAQPGVTGLRNLGNTCYMNSVLQVLSNLEEFRDYFLAYCPMHPVLDRDPSDAAYCCSTQNRTAPTKTAGDGESDDQPVEQQQHRPRKRYISDSDAADEHHSHASLSREVGALLNVMWSGKLSLVIPQGFLEAVWKRVPSFKGYHQQDAQEFLAELLDKLAEERLSESDGDETSAADRVLPPRVKSVPAKKPPSAVAELISQIFTGETESCVTCMKCRRSTSRKEAFSDLSLEFPTRYQHCLLTSLNLALESCRIDEMLDSFTSVEELGKVYSCERCNGQEEVTVTTGGAAVAAAADTTTEATTGGEAKRTRSSARLSKLTTTTGQQRQDSPSSGRTAGKNPTESPTIRTHASKQMLISKLPRILRLHLKRFRWGGRNQRDKISVHAKFQPTIDIKSYCVDGIQGSTKYRLCGVVSHHGRGFNSGHYTSYCWHSIGQFWMHCNDARLQMSNLQEVLTAQAYILFYSRENAYTAREHAPAPPPSQPVPRPRFSIQPPPAASKTSSRTTAEPPKSTTGPPQPPPPPPTGVTKSQQQPNHTAAADLQQTQQPKQPTTNTTTTTQRQQQQHRSPPPPRTLPAASVPLSTKPTAAVAAAPQPVLVSSGGGHHRIAPVTIRKVEATYNKQSVEVIVRSSSNGSGGTTHQHQHQQQHRVVQHHYPVGHQPPKQPAILRAQPVGTTGNGGLFGGPAARRLQQHRLFPSHPPPRRLLDARTTFVIGPPDVDDDEPVDVESVDDQPQHRRW